MSEEETITLTKSEAEDCLMFARTAIEPDPESELDREWIAFLIVTHNPECVKTVEKLKKFLGDK